MIETWFIWALLGRGTNGPVLRHLNLPTNEAWIDPWVTQLRELGTRLRLRHELVELKVRRGQITAARLRTPRGRRIVEADYYVCALPLERARRLWSPEILRADPALAQMSGLSVTWYSGISYFLREQAHILDGIVICGDSPWAGTFITQAQYWPVDFAKTYGDGTVHDKLSAVVADWTTPGVKYPRTPRELTPRQLALDMWEQVKQHVNNPGQATALTDEMLHSWQIDPGLLRRRGRWINEDPLGLPTVDSDRYRPQARTRIDNLMLCGDYLKSSWEVTNMETACYNGRRAARAVLEAANSRETPIQAIEPWKPPEMEPLKRIDEDRYRRGQPNLFDADLTSAQVGELLRQPFGAAKR